MKKQNKKLLIIGNKPLSVRLAENAVKLNEPQCETPSVIENEASKEYFCGSKDKCTYRGLSSGRCYKYEKCEHKQKCG